MDEGWTDSGYSLGRQVLTRIVEKHSFDTIEARGIVLKDALDERGYSCWSIDEREIDGKMIYFLEIHDVITREVPNGTMLDFPYLDMLYFFEDDKIFQVEMDDTIDYYIRDLIIDLNKMGLFTYTSCSGLVEDHIDDFPYNEMSNSFIIFDDCVKRPIIDKLISGTDWILEERHFDTFDDVMIYIEGVNDKEILAAWDVLKDCIIKLDYGKEGGKVENGQDKN